MPEVVNAAFGVLGITPGMGSGSLYFGIVSGSSVPPGSGAASDVAVVVTRKAAADTNPFNPVLCDLMVCAPSGLTLRRTPRRIAARLFRDAVLFALVQQCARPR